MESIPEMKIPEKFYSIINDFISDLSTTFPEYSYLWSVWTDQERIPELYQYCLTVYPERFFDILYQNDNVFDSNSEMNTLFLPNVEFKMLFAIPDISENTKKTMWKYLQLILMTIMGGIKEKTAFGDAANLFQGINENELQSKLSETINELSQFFEKSSTEDAKEDTNDESSTKVDDDIPDLNEMPNVDDLHGHLKGLFDGKIGSLAKELAEELSEDLMGEFGNMDKNTSTNEIFQNIIKDPSKLMGMMKKVSSKLDEKMKSGDISQEDIMKELSELMGNMKGMSKGGDMKNILKKLMQKFGPMLKGMGGMENMGSMEEMLQKMMGSFTQPKMTQMNSIQKHKERMRAKLEKRKNDALLESSKKGEIQSTENPNQYVFKIDGEVQEKSTLKPIDQGELNAIHDDWLNEPITEKQPKTGGKKGKGKKGKK